MGAEHATFWDGLRSWAEAAGLTVPESEGGGGAAPRVPEAVCANCPICQGAATLEQLNPVLVDDLAFLARSVLGGISSALSVAAEQRRDAGPDEESSSADSDDRPHPGERDSPAA